MVQMHNFNKWLIFFKVRNFMSFGVGMASMEKEIAQYIISLGKTPVAWEEALFRTGVVREYNKNSSERLLFGCCSIGGPRDGLSSLEILQSYKFYCKKLRKVC